MTSTLPSSFDQLKDQDQLRTCGQIVRDNLHELLVKVLMADQVDFTEMAKVRLHDAWPLILDNFMTRMTDAILREGISKARELLSPELNQIKQQVPAPH